LNDIDFDNIFYTLHVDGSYYINKLNSKTSAESLCLYKCNKQDATLPSIEYCLESASIPNTIQKPQQQTRNIAIWIRNTNKWPERNMHHTTYNIVFRYCIEKQITCKVFLDLIPVQLPDSQYIINATTRFKNRPDWDNITYILQECDFFIGTDSGSSEFVLLSIDINCLFEKQLRQKKNIQNMINMKKQNGSICEVIDFNVSLYNILDEYYGKQ
jgi:hypothetical protein